MIEKVNVSVDEVKRVYGLLEELNSFFHEPMNFKNPKDTAAFATTNYQEIKELYSQVVWN